MNKRVDTIKQSINKYGTNISTKNFILEVLGIISGIIVISIFLKLKSIPFIILIIVSILIIPLIVLAWFKQMASAKKFSLLTDYLSNIIPIFMQKSKVRYTLGELSTITSDIMKDSIDKAIEYIDKTKDDPDLLKNALKIIENEFPNSRVKSVHQFLVSVEDANSATYKDIANNLYEDIEGWIKRTYTFKKDLTNRRNKLLILCVLTLLMDLMFVYVYGANEFFQGYTDNIFYQISSTVFVVSIEIISVVILVKLNGDWLINDIDMKNEERIKTKYYIYKKGIVKLSVVDYIFGALFLASGIFFIFNHNNSLGYACFLLVVVLLTQKTRTYNYAKKSITKKFIIEFPIWLREVSLTLGSLTVLNAIENSINTVSYPFRKELREFLKEANKDPTSIKPYNDFLIEYDLEDARSSMRVLYAINNVSKNDMRLRISNLIVRNQDMLAKSESIRNEDSIGWVEALGYLPTVIFSIQIVISMFIMFYYMLNRVSGDLII